MLYYRKTVITLFQDYCIEVLVWLLYHCSTDSNVLLVYSYCITGSQLTRWTPMGRDKDRRKSEDDSEAPQRADGSAGGGSMRDVRALRRDLDAVVVLHVEHLQDLSLATSRDIGIAEADRHLVFFINGMLVGLFGELWTKYIAVPHHSSLY